MDMQFIGLLATGAALVWVVIENKKLGNAAQVEEA